MRSQQHMHSTNSFRDEDTKFGILNSKECWMPEEEGGKPKEDAWYQIDLGETKQVTGVIIQGIVHNIQIFIFVLGI